MSEYKEEDIVLVGWTADSEPKNSTKATCYKCGKPVWVTHGTMNTVLDKTNETGGKLYIVCLMCAPEPDDPNNEIQIGDEQKAEMLAEGFDFDEFQRRSGLSLTEIAKMVVKKEQFLDELRSLHRAANPGGCGSPICSVCRKEES